MASFWPTATSTCAVYKAPIKDCGANRGKYGCTAWVTVACVNGCAHSVEKSGAIGVAFTCCTPQETSPSDCQPNASPAVRACTIHAWRTKTALGKSATSAPDRIRGIIPVSGRLATSHEYQPPSVSATIVAETIVLGDSEPKLNTRLADLPAASAAVAGAYETVAGQNSVRASALAPHTRRNVSVATPARIMARPTSIR